MRTEDQHSAGGVVVRAGRGGAGGSGGGAEVLLISVGDGRRWQLPKGRIEAGESPQQAALREVREETGVSGRVLAELPAIDYWFVQSGRRIHKRVDYFLLAYESGSTADFDSREVSGAEFLPWDEAERTLSFANERHVVAAAREAWARRGGEGGSREEEAP
ncbi:MAG TPA: NUDIX hydrolase [Thermoanaerobaculia bacterium]|nr:NUDIX hydrolase [Thermoanaerobaculia bacterium]